MLLPWLVRLDGKPHADWQQFLGRFHPLVVHLPIGLLVLVPVLEIAGSIPPRIARGGGVCAGAGIRELPGRADAGVSARLWQRRCGTRCDAAHVGRHRADHRRVAVLAGAALVVWGTCRMCIRRCSPACCWLLVWTAHQGGSLTHGSNYLTAIHAGRPEALDCSGTRMRQLPDSFYAQQINPIFEANCVTCHGDGKDKGRSAAGLL